MLVIVLAFGFIGKGAQRWIDLGVVRFQPSEVMKLAVPMMVAWTATRRFLPLPWWYIGVCFSVIAAPAALIGLQPDLGTALLVSFAGLVVIFLAGISWKFIVTMVVFLSVSAPLMWKFVFHDFGDDIFHILVMIYIDIYTCTGAPLMKTHNKKGGLLTYGGDYFEERPCPGC